MMFWSTNTQAFNFANMTLKCSYTKSHCTYTYMYMYYMYLQFMGPT